MLKKFPLVRLRQFVTNPLYVFFWLKRVFWYKKHSFDDIEQRLNDYHPMSPEETLKYIIENNKSIIRFGDGEFGVLSGAGIFPPDSDWSQRYSSKLKHGLMRLMRLQSKNVVLAFPSREFLLQRAETEVHDHIIPHMHIEARLFLPYFIKHNEKYGDCRVFVSSILKEKGIELIREHLANKKVVIVTGNAKSLPVGKIGKELYFVDAGKHDAFARYSDIICDVETLISSEKLEPHETLFMISLGATAGFLVEYLSSLSFTAWDTGHMFRMLELNKIHEYEK